MSVWAFTLPLITLLPICSHCHRNRDEQEYRNRLTRPKAPDPRRIPRVPPV
jgi:hypothetical protein